MIYFTLPNFFENFVVNNFFIELNKSQSSIFKEKITFIQSSGNFPYCSWHGGYNNNRGAGAYYDDFNECYKKSYNPLRINFANAYLNHHDFYDAMANIILETNNNGSNCIEISNLELMDYIVEKYPNYKFVFSKQAHLINSFTPELINQIIDLDKFYLIGIPDEFSSDFEFLRQINKKSKIEITVNPTCPRTCKNLSKCLSMEHESQLEYSSYSYIFNCNKIFNYGYNQRLKTLEEIKKEYLPIGITHFTFSPYPADGQSVFSFYLQYFVKEEYHNEVLKYWESMVNQQNGG